jgi:threonine/homoserine/homoserine lactone efflux protein
MSEFVTLILFLFPLAYTPGPGNLFFAAAGARFGFRATVPASAGYHLATMGLTTAIGFGITETAAVSGWLLQVIRIAGGLYILYLAYGFLRATVTANTPEPRRAGFGDGAILLLMNPKAWVIIALMLSQFLGAEDIRPHHVLIIASIFTLNNLIAFSAYTLAGDRLARLFRDILGAHRLNAVFGAVLAATALWLMFD